MKGKTVLITGGTGYLGKHIVKRLLTQDIHAIRVFSRDEVKHHVMQELFGQSSKLRHLIGDVRDYERLRKATRGCDIVIHAAALKRLDLMEYNVEESIKTNILGTLNVVNACLENNVEKAIFISTDKACAPVNTYGACKFVSERIFTESNYSKGTSRTKFICVRYGNVLESTGSVIPFFESKIKNHEEIPLTDAAMTRFIITGEQAVDLIFNAIDMGRGGEIFVPKLPALRITDLIELLKRKHNAKNPVRVIGIRPGEKIYEIMINSAEVHRTYDHRKNYVICSHIEKNIELEVPVYIKEGTLLNQDTMVEYSSKDSVIPIEEAGRLLKQLDIL